MPVRRSPERPFGWPSDATADPKSKLVIMLRCFHAPPLKINVVRRNLSTRSSVTVRSRSPFWAHSKRAKVSHSLVPSPDASFMITCIFLAGSNRRISQVAALPSMLSITGG